MDIICERESMSIKERLAIARAMIKYGKGQPVKLGNYLLKCNSPEALKVKSKYHKQWSIFQKLSMKDRGVYA